LLGEKETLGNEVVADSHLPCSKMRFCIVIDLEQMFGNRCSSNRFGVVMFREQFDNLLTSLGTVKSRVVPRNTRGSFLKRFAFHLNPL
jgi:hypothetical protein